MTQTNEKQQSYNNETKDGKRTNRTTIIQQSFKNENQWNTPKKHENETQQWKTTLKHSNDTQHLKTIVQQRKNNETQEWENNNCSTIIQHSYSKEKQWKT